MEKTKASHVLQTITQSREANVSIAEKAWRTSPKSNKETRKHISVPEAKAVPVSCMMQCTARQEHVHGAYQPNLLQSTVASQPNLQLQSAEGGKGKAAVPAK